MMDELDLMALCHKRGVLDWFGDSLLVKFPKERRREISNNFEVFICFLLGTEGPGKNPNTVDEFF